MEWNQRQQQRQPERSRPVELEASFRFTLAHANKEQLEAGCARAQRNHVGRRQQRREEGVREGQAESIATAYSARDDRELKL